MVKDLESEVRDLDRRLTHVEALVNNILSSINEIKASLAKVTESQQALGLGIALILIALFWWIKRKLKFVF